MQKNGTIDEVSPPLKWAGGKRWLIPHLGPVWDTFRKRVMVEPFCGGLGVSLSLNPDRAVLNDANQHAVNFYRWLGKGLKTKIRMENDQVVYYQNRDRFNELISLGKSDTSEAAALFYYLNRTGFNGLCRFNSKGGFNVPFGKYKTINYTRDFSPFKKAFKNWKFSCGDFEKVTLAGDDFLYADPPYDVEFTQYSPGGFSWNDQVRLVKWLIKHPGPVVASNQGTERILELYREHGFEINLLDAPRRISCTGDRTPAREMLARRNC